MKCPIITAGFFADMKASGHEGVDCFQEACAWWDKLKGVCCIKVLAKELSIMQVKMSHAGQFLK